MEVLACTARYKYTLLLACREQLASLFQCVRIVCASAYARYQHKTLTQHDYTSLMKVMEDTSRELGELSSSCPTLRSVDARAKREYLRKVRTFEHRFVGVSQQFGCLNLLNLLRVAGISHADEEKEAQWWVRFLDEQYVISKFEAAYRLTSGDGAAAADAAAVTRVVVPVGSGTPPLEAHEEGPGATNAARSPNTPVPPTPGTSTDANAGASAAAANDDAADATADSKQHAVNIQRILAAKAQPPYYHCFAEPSAPSSAPPPPPTGGGAGAGARAGKSPASYFDTRGDIPLFEYVNGANVYVVLRRAGWVLQLKGYFRHDYFQLLEYDPNLRSKIRHIRMFQRSDRSSECETKFAHNWFRHLSQRDCLVYSSSELNAQCVEQFSRLKQMKQCTIANMVKMFLSSSIHEQRDILTLFLLTEEDSDTQYLAYLMYDMISQESYLLKPQPLAENIYNNLHWIVQRRFKVVLESIQMERGTREFNEQDIDYESRIRLMKAAPEVKQKAHDKLKEIRSKNNDNSHKALQYLEGLLRVPFGIFRREQIFVEMDAMRTILLTQYRHLLANKANRDERSVRAECDDKTSTDMVQRLIHVYSVALGGEDEGSAVVDEDDDTTAATATAMARATATHMTFDKARQLICSLEAYVQAAETWDLTSRGEGAGEEGAGEGPPHLERLEEQIASVDRLAKFCTGLRKHLGVKHLEYTDSDGATRRVQCKHRVGKSFVAYEHSVILHSLMCFCQFAYNHQPRRYQKIRQYCDKHCGGNGACAAATTTPAAAAATTSFARSADNNEAAFDMLAETKSAIAKWRSYNALIAQYMRRVDDVLDSSIYGHTNAKRSIKQVVAQWITGEQKGYCFGFEGPPGTGKTSLAKYGLARCLEDANGQRRPFAFIALGGSCNGSTLEGHSYTYVGSTWGRIVDILMETRCMNPIIYIDELDKISRTEHGREIVGILTHITDSSQNDEFVDKYFSGVKLDLSRVLFVFSYNDPELIDPILRDRIHKVKFNPLKQVQKKVVANSYLIPQIAKTIGVHRDNILISDEVLDYIIDNYTREGGVRKLKEKLFEIYRDLNIRNLMGTLTYPVAVTTDMLRNDLFIDHAVVEHTKILPIPRIGLTNGMYATAIGVGGITIIECFVVPRTNFMSLELTGQQGDVMKESMAVAKTVAWNLLQSETQNEIFERSKTNGVGLHVHCPDGGTPKDGPSAGTAITISILSCLLNEPVCNTVAITGEIDLNGRVRQIGGLDTKIAGAHKAGVSKVLFPTANANDYRRLTLGRSISSEELRSLDVERVQIDTIWDVLPHVFPNVDYEFRRY
jgi:ATP-dependent Lon protease